MKIHNKSKTISSPIFIISFILLPLFYSIVNAVNPLIPETCKKLSQLDSRVYYDFCGAALGTAPGVDGATNITQLGSISFHLDISEINSILSKIETLLNDPKSDPLTTGALEACTELYSSARDDLGSGLEYFENGNYLMANMRANNALNDAINCEKGFKKNKGVVSVLSTENSDFIQLAAISIGFTKLLGVTFIH
ncbi:hypothetical protein RND81_02G132600 [Saponaria officinalis]|uniref:Pectinesterase inhibitor domain-containing protein n=1 Tax=Saponaria officinalis TaxID=3572 RepID=A0AAW1MTW2_SAPOF